MWPRHINNMYPLVILRSYGKWTIYSGFTHWKWWFSILMLVYQRVHYLMWLVVWTILKNDRVRQWEWWHPIYEMENKIHVPNHQQGSYQSTLVRVLLYITPRRQVLLKVTNWNLHSNVEIPKVQRLHWRIRSLSQYGRHINLQYHWTKLTEMDKSHRRWPHSSNSI